MLSRQILLNACPGAHGVPSGTVTSVTNAALFVHVPLPAGGAVVGEGAPGSAVAGVFVGVGVDVEGEPLSATEGLT